jgi:hypothetical protein
MLSQLFRTVTSTFHWQGCSLVAHRNSNRSQAWHDASQELTEYLLRKDSRQFSPTVFPGTVKYHPQSG